MESSIFNKTFFRFSFGFLAIIVVSFVLVNVLVQEGQKPKKQEVVNAKVHE